MFQRTIIFIFILFANTSFAKGVDKFIFPQKQTAPVFSFVSENDEKHNLSDYKGKVVLLNFWATWCAPCVHEMPALDSLQGKFDKEKFVIVPVSLDTKGVEVVKKFLESKGIKNLPVLLDNEKSAFKLFGLKALPTSYIIDKNSDLRAGIMGLIEWESEDTENYIKGLIDEK